MKRQAGYSLIELLLATMIGSIALMMAVSVITMTQIQGNRAILKMESIIEQALGQKFLWFDLRGAGPSFNNLVQLDDNGNNFFDYMPDYPMPNSARSLTLTTTNGKSIVFLIIDTRRERPVLYEPGKAYDFVYSTAADKTLSGSMVYRGLNKLNSKGVGTLDALNPSLFKDNALLLLTGPSLLRPPNAAPNSVPKNHAFLGRVARAAGTVTLDRGPGNLFSVTHPVDPTLNVLTEDQFFQTLPSQSGGGQIVFIQPVRIFRYVIQAGADSIYSLNKQMWNGSTFNNPIMIANNVTEVKFTRNSINDPTVEYDIKTKDAAGGP